MRKVVALLTRLREGATEAKLFDEDWTKDIDPEHVPKLVSVPRTAQPEAAAPEPSHKAHKSKKKPRHE